MPYRVAEESDAPVSDDQLDVNRDHLERWRSTSLRLSNLGEYRESLRRRKQRVFTIAFPTSVKSRSLQGQQ